MDIIGCISCSGFREILSGDNINKKFADLDIQLQFEDRGLITPMGNSNKIFFELGDDDLNYFNKYKDIYQIFKERQIKIK